MAGRMWALRRALLAAWLAARATSQEENSTKCAPERAQLDERDELISSLQRQLVEEKEKLEDKELQRSNAAAAKRIVEAELNQIKAELSSMNNRTEHLRQEAESAALNNTNAWEKARVKQRDAEAAEQRAEESRLAAEQANQLAARRERQAEKALHEAEAARSEATEAREAAATAEKRFKLQSPGRFWVWLGLPSAAAQPWLAGFAGLLAVVSVVGPSSFTKKWWALSGSVAAGAVVAASVSFFCFQSDGDELTFSDCLRTLIAGTGSTVGYWVMAVVSILSLTLYAAGYQCSLYTTVDELMIRSKDGCIVLPDGSGLQCGLQRPLMSGGEAVGNKEVGCQVKRMAPQP